MAVIDQGAAARPERKRKTSALRGLPSVDACLETVLRQPAAAQLNRDYLKAIIREVIAGMRAEIANSAAPEFANALGEVLARADRQIRNDSAPMKTVVNATGVVLHTNLGRATLAQAALEAMATAARNAVNLEYDLATGARGHRDSLIEADLCALTGAEAGTVVNNNAAAVLLVVNTLARGREVVVSRGELVEIGGSFRIPEVISAAGARLREVGTTNRTHPRDYSNAIGPETALLMKIHPSNFQIVGFTESVQLARMVAIGREHELSVVEDLGAGALIDLSAHGLPREPIVRERIAAGAALVTFSGDKLLGGPQAGIIVGRRTLIEQLRKNPLWRALRCDKLRLAALGATLRLYMRSGNLAEELPVLRMMRRRPTELESLAQKAQRRLQQTLPAQFAIEIIKSSAAIGSGSMPAQELESRALRITHRAISPERIAAAFREARVIGRIHEDAFLLDLFTIDDPAALDVKLRLE